jgi:hypothetical protein
MFSRGKHTKSGVAPHDGHDFNQFSMEGKSVQKNRTFFAVLLHRAAALLLVLSAALIISCQDIGGVGEGTTPDAPALSLVQRTVKVGQSPVFDQASLANIANNPGGDYVLTNSFAITGWAPICDPNDPFGNGPFTGSLDGAGFTITINSFDTSAVTDYLGIFAQSMGATFEDLTVDIEAGVVQTNVPYVGGLVGQAVNTLFDAVDATGVFEVAAGATGDMNVGLIAGSMEKKSDVTHSDIDATLHVVYNNQSANNANVGGVTGYLVASTVRNTTIGESWIYATATMPAADYPAPSIYLSVGGAAGNAVNAEFARVTVGAGTRVSATSAQTSVFVGGVVGQGLNVSVTNSASAAAVSGDGQQYDTAAGGIAGHITQSTVTGSEASGDITINAAWGVGSYDYWQAYAGGLVGYSGGTQNGNSVIEGSHASGNVHATTVYPYAGGLVGYNYGYIEFTSAEARRDFYRTHGTVGASVTSNGSRINRSYATGNVTATSQPASNGLPYAGGLAGYSSIPTGNKTANIENSYARGIVTATTDSKYGWAGGLAGANAQGSVIATCYATGAVYVTVGSNELPYSQPGINPGAAGGGIVGVNYYADERGNAALTTLSVALNPSITGSAPGVVPYLLHRVAGDLGATGYVGSLDDNEANNAMVITPVWNPEIGPDLRDGASIAQVFQSWDFTNVWTKGGDGYPALR